MAHNIDARAEIFAAGCDLDDFRYLAVSGIARAIQRTIFVEGELSGDVPDMTGWTPEQFVEYVCGGENKPLPFVKLPSVQGSVACPICGCGARSDLAMDRIIGVGFGDAGYSRDGETLWNESAASYGAQEDEEIQYPTVSDVETLAKADPDHDWRIWFYAPLYEAEYQRQGDGIWVLVMNGEGFA